MPGETVICPACGQSDAVDKVSVIYMEGLGAGKLSRVTGYRQADSEKRLTKIPPERLRLLSRNLAPPQSPAKVQTRAVHPDLAVIAFTFILPFLLGGVWRDQRPLFWGAAGLVAIAYAFYFWQRRRIIARFQQGQSAQKGEDERIRRGIHNWMRLYYCDRDEGVFEPGRGELIPLDEMMNWLLGRKTQPPA